MKQHTVAAQAQVNLQTDMTQQERSFNMHHRMQLKFKMLSVVCLALFIFACLLPVQSVDARSYAKTFDCTNLHRAWSATTSIDVYGGSESWVRFDPGRAGTHKIKLIRSGTVIGPMAYYPYWYSGSRFGGGWGPYKSNILGDTVIVLKSGDSSIWYEIMLKNLGTFKMAGTHQVQVYCD